MAVYRQQETPRSTEQLRAFCEAMRAEHNANHDHLEVVAAALRNSLKRSVQAGPLIAPSIARRVTRHLRYAADLNQQAARAALRTWHEYERLVLNVRDAGNVPFKI